ncbi:unnamed protein product [Arctogadus glacialis]
MRLEQEDAVVPSTGPDEPVSGPLAVFTSTDCLAAKYGKCYMFNAVEEGKTLRTTMKGGTGNGLEIMLDIQQDEYLPVWGDTGLPSYSLYQLTRKGTLGLIQPFAACLCGIRITKLQQLALEACVWAMDDCSRPADTGRSSPNGADHRGNGGHLVFAFVLFFRWDE